MGLMIGRQRVSSEDSDAIEPPRATHYNPSVTHKLHRSSLWHVGCGWIVLVCLLVGSCSSSSRVAQDVIPSASPPSEDEDTRISREFRREIKKYVKFVNDPEVDRYVDGVGRRIVSALGPQSFDYRYFVIDESVLNAFAVPGGSIYIYSGLLDRVRSTDELAAVMAHETTHVAKRHMARMSGIDPISVLSLVGALLAARAGAGAQAAAVLGQGIAAARQIAFTRQLELEADTLGFKFMTQAGYDPHAMLSFQKLMLQEQTLNPIDVPPFLLDHPLTQERVANVELLMRSIQSSEPAATGIDPIKKIQTLIRLEKHEADTVIAEQKKVLSQFPRNSEAYQLLGIAFFSKGMWQEARNNLEQALALNPKSPGIHRDLGRVYTQINDYRSAHAAFDRSLALEQQESLTYLYLGELYEKEGDLGGAAGAYLNANNLSPLWDKPSYQLSVVYGKLDRLADAYYYHGRWLLLQDDDQRAAADFDKAIKILGEQSPRGQLIKEELAALRSRRK
jgi:predicted Zn-dependent protease